MTKLIGFNQACTLVLFFFVAILIFHVLAILGFVPAEMLWGGNAGDLGVNLRVLELIAVIVICIFGAVILAKMKAVRSGKQSNVATTGTWIIFAYLVLNLFANLFSENLVEKIVFTVVAGILAICVLRIAMEKVIAVDED